MSHHLRTTVNAFCPQHTLAQGSSKAQRCACLTPKGKGVL